MLKQCSRISDILIYISHKKMRRKIDLSWMFVVVIVLSNWLARFMTLAFFYTPWKYQKTYDFLFPGGIESDQWVNLTKQNINCVSYKRYVLHDWKPQTLTDQAWNFVKFQCTKNDFKYTFLRELWKIFFNSINHFLRVLSTNFFLVVCSTAIARTSILS